MKGAPGPWDLWGKLGAGGAEWHPLIDHSLDVAGVLVALLEQPTLHQRLARAGGLDQLNEALIAQLGFLGFIHDLGKCALGFRAKGVPELGRQAGHLATLRPLLDGPLQAEAITLLEAEQLQHWAGDRLESWLKAVFAHHGRTPDLCYNKGSDYHLCQGWTGRDREPLRRLAELVAAGRARFPAAFAADAPPLPTVPALQHLFAGLLMLADWIGSDSSWFRFAEPGDPSRADHVHAQAKPVLLKIGLIPPTLPRPLPSFEAQFGFGPRVAQQAIDTLPLPGPEGSVVLLESETGSGKTEAALRWASRLIEAGLVDGCFFAVPLRAAAVQLHRRMQRWLDAMYPGQTVEALLAVPGYYRMGDAEGRVLPEFKVQWSDRETEAREDGRWAAEQPKRYAAASFAVGTIDQALLGVLAVKHAHLRSACLVRHLLVIDEIHSSDAYMTRLIERLLALFRLAGGHVLLMSATVGAGTRERLVAERKEAPEFEDALKVPYPRITASYLPPVDDIQPDGAEKLVWIEPCPLIDDAPALAERVAAALDAGARVLVLRNTVTAAIATQLAIEALLPPDDPALFRVEGVATLHHGRFAAEDRKRLDAAVEQRYGRDAPAGCSVVVATQTLEQSLDVDADLLVTDLCPIDVLLQRIGRLHRHARQDRPAAFAKACCVLMLPTSPDLSPLLKASRHGIGKERAYDNLLAVEATRRLVMDAPLWSIPRDNRRLVETGTHPGELQRLADGMSAAWANAWGQYQGGKSAERVAAADVSIDFRKPFAAVSWPDGAEKVATRLGARDLLLPLDPPLPSPFDGTLIKHLKLPHWMAPDGLPEDAAFTTDADGRLQLADATYRYDRLGLQRLPDTPR